MCRVPPTRRPHSRPIPRPRKLTLRLHPRDVEALSAIAHRSRISVEDLATQVIGDYLHRHRTTGGTEEASR